MNPFLNGTIYVLFVFATTVVAVLVARRLQRTWQEERRRLRATILAELGLGDGQPEDSGQEGENAPGIFAARDSAPGGILGIVPAFVVATHGAASAKPLSLVSSDSEKVTFVKAVGSSARPFWLCFLRDCILSIQSDTGGAVKVDLRDLKRLELVEGATNDACLAVQTMSGTSEFDKILIGTKRVDDMVRVVNILIQQGIAVKYRRVAL